MENENDSAVLAYIRHVLDHMQISPSALAKMAGISSTTLTRPLNNSQYKFNLSATTLEKIASASGVNPGPIFKSKDHPSRALATYFDPEMYDPKQSNEHEHEHENKSTVIIGYAGLGLWYEISMLHSDFIGALDVAPIFYAPKDCFAVIVRDWHAGEFAYIDDNIVCVRTKAYQHEIIEGTEVLLERRKEGGRLIELTARRLHKTKAGWNLNTLTKNARGYDQFFMESLEETDEASIAGVVLCSVRYP